MKRARSRRSAPKRTGYTVHTGANEKFVAGWDKVFGNKPPASKPKSKKTAAKSTRKSPKKPRR